ncbi:hypothetical protein V1L52_06000 [Treponema sp. HNW]|uniref:hypothetical protein n=1 Tax=Treponema sp. HNW TaxID=3116654 RepID=UPI003D148785
MKRTSDAQAREEFFNEMGERFHDKVISVEMVCLEAEDEVFALLKLKPVQKQSGLWGLLIIGENDLYFYAHPSESPLLGLFRAASNGKPPVEQMCSFAVFKSRRIYRVEKRGLFGKRYDKYLLAVDAVLQDDTELVFFIRTQNSAQDVTEKLAHLTGN